MPTPAPFTDPAEGLLLAAADGRLADREIRHEVTVPCTPAEAWIAWTQPDALSAWLETPCSVELRIGGPFEIYFLDDAPVGERGSEGCRILSYLPERMLSFSWNAPPHLRYTRSRYTWVVVEFSAQSDGTRLSLVHIGWPQADWNNSPEWEATFAYFSRAWGALLRIFGTAMSQRTQTVP